MNSRKLSVFVRFNYDPDEDDSPQTIDEAIEQARYDMVTSGAFDYQPTPMPPHQDALMAWFETLVFDSNGKLHSTVSDVYRGLNEIRKLI
jgi:hypothetical protein